ncbi:hypothetical protein NDU88_001624, partial [Pleurodeles waltl]
ISASLQSSCSSGATNVYNSDVLLTFRKRSNSKTPLELEGLSTTPTREHLVSISYSLRLPCCQEHSIGLQILTWVNLQYPQSQGHRHSYSLRPTTKVSASNFSKSTTLWTAGLAKPVCFSVLPLPISFFLTAAEG